MSNKNFTLAGPSFVVPGTIKDNVLVLKDLVSEVGLTFFHTSDCLRYSSKDLPEALAGMGVDYHVHLPLDLDWSQGATRVFDLVSALVRKAGFLSPDKYVLHPPAGASDLEEFAVLWQAGGFNPRELLVENICGHDLSSLWPVIEAQGLGICLDIGHVMAYDQWNILKKDILWERTSLVHVYGREDHAGHTGLKALSPEGESLLKLVLSRVEQNSVILLEIFSLRDFLDSRDILIQMADSWGLNFV